MRSPGTVTPRRNTLGGRRSSSRAPTVLAPTRSCAGPASRRPASRTNSRIAALRERDKRSETFREILNGDACHTHLICNAHAQPPDDAGPSVPAPRLKKAEVAKLGAAGTQRVDAVVRWMTGRWVPLRRIWRGFCRRCQWHQPSFRFGNAIACRARTGLRPLERRSSGAPRRRAATQPSPAGGWKFGERPNLKSSAFCGRVRLFSSSAALRDTKSRISFSVSSRSPPILIFSP